MDIHEVNKVAQLARLNLTAEETERLTRELARVLDYVSVLNEIDTDDVEPMVHAIEVRNAFRGDDPVPSLSRQDALSNAPSTDGSYFLVPDILRKERD